MWLFLCMSIKLSPLSIHPFFFWSTTYPSICSFFHHSSIHSPIHPTHISIHSAHPSRNNLEGQCIHLSFLSIHVSIQPSFHYFIHSSFGWSNAPYIYVLSSIHPRIHHVSSIPPLLSIPAPFLPLLYLARCWAAATQPAVFLSLALFLPWKQTLLPPPPV